MKRKKVVFKYSVAASQVSYVFRAVRSSIFKHPNTKIELVCEIEFNQRKSVLTHDVILYAKIVHELNGKTSWRKMGKIFENVRAHRNSDINLNWNVRLFVVKTMHWNWFKKEPTKI